MAGVLSGLRRKLAQLASPQLRYEISVATSRDFSRRIDRGFETETDPYGVPWRPSKKTSGKTLTKTGALRSGLFVEADATQVRVRITGPAKRYGKYHRTGTKRMPRRRFIPDDADLPNAWKMALDQLSDDYFRKRVGR